MIFDYFLWVCDEFLEVDRDSDHVALQANPKLISD